MDQKRDPYASQSFLSQPLNHLISLLCHDLQIRRVPKHVLLQALRGLQLLAASTALIILAHGTGGTLME